MIYTDAWAFIHIPKTSGYNFRKNALASLSDVRQPYDLDNPNPKIYRHAHNPYWYFEDLISDKFVFSIVRNPYSRMVSYYKMAKGAGMKGCETMESWLDHKPDPNRIWDHKTTQKQFLTARDGTIVVNAYKIESDLLSLEKKLGFEFTHTRMNTAPDSYDWKDYMTPYVKSEIERVFKDDFEFFSY